MRERFKRLLVVVMSTAMIAGIILPAVGQNPTGSVRGTVTDEHAAVITNAMVTVTNKATGSSRKVSTGGDGIYAVDNLLPGTYEVKIEAQGFATQVITATVQVGNTTSGDATMRAGAKEEVVDVVAEASTINKEEYKIDGVITRQKVDALPLNGRNFLQLASLEPGVSVSASNPGAQNNLFNVSIGGANAALTRLTVDGGSILDPVCGGAAQNFSTETVQEFQISTFNFDLSTGVTSVGAVNIVSRTGSNDFHGNAFLYFRDHSISALPTFFRPDSNFDPFFRRYQYGGALSGPIKKDKVFFFGNVERLDQNSAISSFVTGNPILPGLPSVSQFSTVLNSPYKGTLGNVRVDIPKLTAKNNLFVRYSHDDNKVFAPDADNTLPSNWRDNGSQDENIIGSLTTILTQTIINDLRFNYQKIQNSENIPTSAHCPADNIGCIGLGGPQIRLNGSNLRLGNTVNAPQARNLDRYQFTDNLNWQKGAHRLRFGGEVEHNYGKGLWAFLDPALMLVHNPRDVIGFNQLVAAGINGNPQIPGALKPALIAALNIPVPANFLTPGAKITYDDLLNLPLIAGSGVPLVGIGDPSQPPPFQGDIARKSNRLRFYGQDSWAVKPGFTFSFGASYTYETNLQNHDLAKPELLLPLIGKVGKPDKDTNNIAPSAGFAWDIGNKGKTVIRGGAGMYYDTILFVTRLRERAAIGPLGNGRSQVPGSFFRNTIVFPQLPIPLPPPLNLINVPLGAPIDFGTVPTKMTARDFLTLLSTQVPSILAQFGTLGSQGVTGIGFFKTGTDLLDPNLQIPYSEQFSIGVQRQLPHDMAVSADFVFRKRQHVLFQNDRDFFNRVPALGGPVLRKCVGLEAINPAVACSNGPISVIESSGRQDYKALLVKFDKRFSKRYQLTASYALSALNTFFTGEDITNPFGHYGPDSADARHRLTVSGVLDLPWGIQGALIATYASRPPFNARINSTNDINGDGTTGDTLPGLKVNGLNRGVGRSEFLTLVNQFNADFAGKPDARGTIVKPAVIPTNFVFGDDFQSEDIRITKTIKIKERWEIQGFFEVFNIFNISNLTFDSSASDITSGNFGLANGRAGQNFGTGGPRALQFGGRFRF